MNFEKAEQYIQNNIRRDINGCWLWNLSKTTKGYGQGYVEGENRRMHIVAFEVYEGEIEGELHHKCGVRHCVRPHPDHVVDVPPDVNQKYSKGWTLNDDGIWSCKRGHRMEGYNVKKAGNGGVCCRLCSNLAARAFRAGKSLKE